MLSWILAFVMFFAVTIMAGYHFASITSAETSVESQDHEQYRKIAKGRGEKFVNSYDLGYDANLDTRARYHADGVHAGDDEIWNYSSISGRTDSALLTLFVGPELIPSFYGTARHIPCSFPFAYNHIPTAVPGRGVQELTTTSVSTPEKSLLTKTTTDLVYWTLLTHSTSLSASTEAC